MSRIVVEDGFLSYQRCVELMDLVQDYPHEIHNGTYTHNVVTLWRENHRLMEPILEKCRVFANELFDWNYKVRIQRGDIVRWPIGTRMAPHYDYRETTSILTSIVYLNDCDEGKTVFDNNLEIQPKAGRVVFYDGKHFEHSVTEVKGNQRYTLALWYMFGKELDK